MPNEILATAASAEEVVVDPVAEEVVESTEEIVQEDKSPYEEELARINAEAKAREDAITAELEEERTERKRQVDLKDKALEKEKSKTQDIGDKLKNEIHQEWERKQDLRDARAQIAGITTDPTAQKVVMHYFENMHESLRTGSVEDQLLTAFALANRKRLPDLISAGSADDMADRQSLSSMGGNDGGSRGAFKTSPSAKAQVASRLSSMFAGTDTKLAKDLADRASNRLKNK